jgi:hypothetical protein
MVSCANQETKDNPENIVNGKEEIEEISSIKSNNIETDIALEKKEDSPKESEESPEEMEEKKKSEESNVGEINAEEISVETNPSSQEATSSEDTQVSPPQQLSSALEPEHQNNSSETTAPQLSQKPNKTKIADVFPKPKCKVKNFRLSNYYDGPCKRGFAHGLGEARGTEDKYVGEFFKGQMHGPGTYVWGNGNRYEGQFENDIKSGEGVFYYANGDIFKGHFMTNFGTGEGLFIWKNGDKYLGNFKYSKKHGEGIFFDSIANNASFVKYENDQKVHSGAIIQIQEIEIEEMKTAEIDIYRMMLQRLFSDTDK